LADLETMSPTPDASAIDIVGSRRAFIAGGLAGLATAVIE